MTDLAIIAHFISDDHNNLVFVGDHSNNFIKEFLSHFDNPQVSHVTTNDFLKLKFNYQDETSIIVLDPEITKLLIHTSTYHPNIDQTDFMIAKRLSDQLNANKLICNTSDVDKECLTKFTDVLDFGADAFDYIISDNLIAIIADPEFIEE